MYHQCCLSEPGQRKSRTTTQLPAQTQAEPVTMTRGGAADPPAVRPAGTACTASHARTALTLNYSVCAGTFAPTSYEAPLTPSLSFPTIPIIPPALLSRQPHTLPTRPPSPSCLPLASPPWPSARAPLHHQPRPSWVQAAGGRPVRAPRWQLTGRRAKDDSAGAPH
jgi:hypothetical protein